MNYNIIEHVEIMPTGEWVKYWETNQNHVIERKINGDCKSYNLKIGWTIQDMENCFDLQEIFEYINDFMTKRKSDRNFWFDITNPEIKNFFGKYYLNCN